VTINKKTIALSIIIIKYYQIIMSIPHFYFLIFPHGFELWRYKGYTLILFQTTIFVDIMQRPHQLLNNRDYRKYIIFLKCN